MAPTLSVSRPLALACCILLSVYSAACSPAATNPDAGTDASVSNDAAAGVPTNVSTYRILPGAGAQGVTPGSVAGCTISANVGGTYRLACSGDSGRGTPATIRGSIWTSGNISNVSPGCQGSCTLETGDSVSSVQTVPGGERIDFSWDGRDGLDGFDFVVTTEPAIFSVLFNGTPQPMQILFPATDNGGQISSVGENPFGLTTM